MESTACHPPLHTHTFDQAGARNVKLHVCLQVGQCLQVAVVFLYGVRKGLWQPKMELNVWSDEEAHSFKTSCQLLLCIAESIPSIAPAMTGTSVFECLTEVSPYICKQNSSEWAGCLPYYNRQWFDVRLLRAVPIKPDVRGTGLLNSFKHKAAKCCHVYILSTYIAHTVQLFCIHTRTP